MNDLARLLGGVTTAEALEGARWWLPLSQRQALADAVFEELKAGGIEVRQAPGRHADRTARAVGQMGA